MTTFTAERPIGTKAEIYRELAQMAGGLFAGERDAIANAANLSALIAHGLADLNWAGFYFLRGEGLVLGPSATSLCLVAARMIDEDVEAHSVHGDVRVGMAAFQGAEVRAETADGEVRSEFPLAMHCDPARGRLASGHVGRSHHVLHLTTVAGDIHLERVVPVL